LDAVRANLDIFAAKRGGTAEAAARILCMCFGEHAYSP
jgi:hypothetical protein